jgi:hypothetical protein
MTVNRQDILHTGLLFTATLCRYAEQSTIVLLLLILSCFLQTTGEAVSKWGISTNSSVRTGPDVIHTLYQLVLSVTFYNFYDSSCEEF